MKVTNKHNLPQVIVDIVENQRKITPKRYSVTEILSGTREILLKRRHNDEIEIDCSMQVNAILGTAAHKVLELAETDTNVKMEERINIEVMDGYSLSGQYDRFIDGVIEDWKTASVFKFMMDDFKDWKRQGMMYAWLKRRLNDGEPVHKVRFYALFKDWSYTKSQRDASYPQSQIMSVEWAVTDIEMKEIDTFIRNKFTELIKYESRELLPMCTQDERWADDDKYAVMKPGRKSAVRVLPNMFEAEQYIIDNNVKNGYVEKREGKDKKCINYCDACKFCDFYKSKYNG